MKMILVATDFSARSDRAMRRAILLAKSLDASMSIVHVVDDDQPDRLISAEREAASALLVEQARTVSTTDGVTCDFSVVLGDAFEGIAKAAADIGPDLVVIGPHRRQALKDVFVGTTAERTIRESGWPVLMANGVPAGTYRQVMIAVDFSDCSGDAVRAATSLGLDRHAATSLIHVFDAPGTGLLYRASVAEDQIEAYLADEEQRAARDLRAFGDGLAFNPTQWIVKRNAGSAAGTISAAAREVSADLVVVGTRGSTGIPRLLLGSVAEEVLRTAHCDVLAVPPRQGG
jgi:nucleotide-binding universal stress UspA family protein